MAKTTIKVKTDASTTQVINGAAAATQAETTAATANNASSETLTTASVKESAKLTSQPTDGEVKLTPKMDAILNEPVDSIEAAREFHDNPDRKEKGFEETLDVRVWE